MTFATVLRAMERLFLVAGSFGLWFTSGQEVILPAAGGGAAWYMAAASLIAAGLCLHFGRRTA